MRLRDVAFALRALDEIEHRQVAHARVPRRSHAPRERDADGKHRRDPHERDPRPLLALDRLEQRVARRPRNQPVQPEHRGRRQHADRGLTREPDRFLHALAVADLARVSAVAEHAPGGGKLGVFRARRRVRASREDAVPEHIALRQRRHLQPARREFLDIEPEQREVPNADLAANPDELAFVRPEFLRERMRAARLRRRRRDERPPSSVERGRVKDREPRLRIRVAQIVRDRQHRQQLAHRHVVDAHGRLRRQQRAQAMSPVDANRPRIARRRKRDHEVPAAFHPLRERARGLFRKPRRRDRAVRPHERIERRVSLPAIGKVVRIAKVRNRRHRVHRRNRARRLRLREDVESRRARADHREHVRSKAERARGILRVAWADARSAEIAHAHAARELVQPQVEHRSSERAFRVGRHDSVQPATLRLPGIEHDAPRVLRDVEIRVGNLPRRLDLGGLVERAAELDLHRDRSAAAHHVARTKVDHRDIDVRSSGHASENTGKRRKSTGCERAGRHGGGVYTPFPSRSPQQPQLDA